MNYCTVKRPFGIKNIIPLVLISLLFVAIAFLCAIFLKFIYIPILILLVGLGVVIYVSPRFLNNEFEYSIEGDLFSIALIMNKASRKELFSSDIEKLVDCAPIGANSSAGTTRKIDVCGVQGAKFVAHFKTEDGTVSLIFTPSDEFMAELRLHAPSKVKTN